MKKKYLIILFVLSFLLQYRLSFSQELGIEELMKVYAPEEVVVTASKREQAIFDSPSAISVVSEEDIKQSGATQLSEALMMVPGVHFGYTLSNCPLAGGIRGFHKLPANKVVLLIDGVPWDFEVYGIPSLFLLPIASLDEIKKIEILRGPGSSLYGANAVFGVINVITKSPQDTKGENYLTFTGGEFDTFEAAYYHGGTIEDRIAYRCSIGWDQRDQWGYVPWSYDPANKNLKFNFVADYFVSDNATINLSGFYGDIHDMYEVNETTGPIRYEDADIYSGVITYTLKEPNIMLRGYYQHKDLWDSGWSRGARNYYLKMGRRGIDFQNVLELFGGKDIFVWGANFVHVYTKGEIVGSKRRHDMSGIFFDNTYRIKDNFKICLGARMDHHPNTGDTASHRLSFIYYPKEEHSFRFTWATSFRNPDFIETYYYSSGSYTVVGHEDNDAEKAETFELGYRGKFNKKLELVGNVFYTKYSDMVFFTQTGTNRYDFLNIEDFKQYGLELEAKYKITSWLTALASYTYLEQWEEDISDRDAIAMTPQHMANFALRAKFDNGFSANISLHYRGTNEWRQYTWFFHPSQQDPRGIAHAGGKADDYLIVNLRLAYAFKMLNNSAEFSISVFNLFDEKYDDYPIDTSDVRRRIVGKFTYKF